MKVLLRPKLAAVYTVVHTRTRVCIVSSARANALGICICSVYATDKENVYPVYDTFSYKVIYLELLEEDRGVHFKRRIVPLHFYI